MSPKRKIVDRVREALRLEHYALHTGQAYVNWINRKPPVVNTWYAFSMQPSVFSLWLEISLWLTYLYQGLPLAPHTQACVGSKSRCVSIVLMAERLQHLHVQYITGGFFITKMNY